MANQKFYQSELLLASEGTLSRCSRLYLQSLAPTNPDCTRIVGFGPFSLCVIQQKVCDPAEGTLIGLWRIFKNISSFMNMTVCIRSGRFLCVVCIYLQKKMYISIYIYPLSRIHNTSLMSANFGLDKRECECLEHLFIINIYIHHHRPLDQRSRDQIPIVSRGFGDQQLQLFTSHG
jgi:hypothetical protein